MNDTTTHNFTVKAGVANLSAERVAKIIKCAISYYIEEHLVEATNEDLAALDDYSWDFKIEEQK
jgi:hypothetical protein